MSRRSSEYLSWEGEIVWDRATQPERNAAIKRAEWILGKLIHYAGARRYEKTDIYSLAAELLVFRAKGIADE